MLFVCARRAAASGNASILGIYAGWLGRSFQAERKPRRRKRQKL